METTCFAYRDLHLSRGFRTLKVWMCLKEQGLDRIGAAIQDNIDQARYLGRLVERTPGLGGRFAIRVANTNHRSELADFDQLVEAVLAIGAELHPEA